MPKVSIVTPVYNGEHTIPAAIASAQGQTEPDWEMLVVDDASTDGTADVVAELAGRDKRIRLLRCATNAGPAAARNLGLDAATGDYIAFLDADDRWLPDKLERQLVLMAKTDADLCICSYFMENDAGQRTVFPVPEHVTYDGLLAENVIGCSTLVGRRELLAQHRFDSGFFHEDYALWLKLMRAGAKAVGITQPLCVYHLGGRSANKLKAALGRWHVYRKGEGLPIFAAAKYLCRYAVAGVKKYRAQ